MSMPNSSQIAVPSGSGSATIDAIGCGIPLEILIARAAGATQRSARGRKYYASALRLSRSRVCRHMNGDPHSPASKVLVALEQLAAGEGTTPWPLLAEGIATVIQADIRQASEAALRARLHELTEIEHGLEAEENRQTARGDDHEAAALADIREAETQLERAAIRRELHARQP
jgi:hypothetical protein